MDSLHSELMVSPPPASPIPSPKPPARVKSPPLAFAPTSNDALASVFSPPSLASPSHNPLGSPPAAASSMGLLSPDVPRGEQHLQVIVDQQANAIQLLHEAFAAERQVWSLEKERLYQRIGSLEQLLKTRDHHSPAKSPIISPQNGHASREGSIASPQARPIIAAPRLPAISEDEGITPLSQRREGAPAAIQLPGRPPVTLPRCLGPQSSGERAGSVSFDDGSVMMEEIPVSPVPTATESSPLPPTTRALAGHTPLKIPRPPTPPPAKLSLDGLDDTPTRNNTHLNVFLTQTHSHDEDVALNGPLNMPELPHQPDESNFTLEALSKRLEQVAQSPDHFRPSVYAHPSPGMMSPTEPNPTDAALPKSSSLPHSGRGSSQAVSPNAVPMAASDSEVVNGVRLKKKASVNFGAPFGQLGGFRKMS